MNCQRVSNNNNININTILQIDYNRIIKLIEKSSENLYKNFYCRNYIKKKDRRNFL